MATKSRRAACERARVWAALLPDGELSLFEQRLLDAHCANCTDCRLVLESVVGVTDVLRTAPLEAMERRVRVVRPRASRWRSASGMLATTGAAAFALVLAFWIGPLGPTSQERTPVISPPVIVFTPESSGGDSAAIWKLKRTHGGGAPIGRQAHRTGPVLF